MKQPDNIREICTREILYHRKNYSTVFLGRVFRGVPTWAFRRLVNKGVSAQEYSYSSAQAAQVNRARMIAEDCGAYFNLSPEWMEENRERARDIAIQSDATNPLMWVLAYLELHSGKGEGSKYKADVHAEAIAQIVTYLRQHFAANPPRTREELNLELLSFLVESLKDWKTPSAPG